jgi:hypothetical protein
MRVAIAWSVVMLTLILPSAATASDDLRSAATHVDRASALLSGSSPQIPAAFTSLVRAMAELAPELAASPDVKRSLLAADETLRRGGKRDHEAVASLHDAYKGLHGGSAFRVTTKTDDIDQLSGELRGRLNAARSLLAKGRASDAMNELCSTSP